MKKVLSNFYLYTNTCYKCSEMITKAYSTSFSLGIRVFSREYRPAIYAIYGYVRFADEIVDTFHDFNKADLLDRFRKDTYKAINEKISLNPVLNSFQNVVNKHSIERDLIDAFLLSMEMDLSLESCEENVYNKYIYGSAEVVGLMCLKVFCSDQEEYNRLRVYARSLGAAFQKINFLRDMRSDFQERGRVYFPGIDYINFNDIEKTELEANIKKDFDHALKGIILLPKGCRLGVYLAYKYYLKLFRKIKNVKASNIKSGRIRVKNIHKAIILFKSALRVKFNKL